jgi:hypothetical protein
VTFKSEYSDGWATFHIGGNKRHLRMDADIYHAVCQIQNWSYEKGAQDAVQGFAAKVAQWAREEELK